MTRIQLALVGQISALGIAFFPSGLQAQVSLTAPNVAYTQNFDSLANSGSTSSILPSGWQLSETGANANTTYAIGTGSGNTGDTYSFGVAGSTDRAFGTLLSGSLSPVIGACFVNNTGAPITSLAIAYTGEQWRLGAIHTAPDRLAFSYAIGTASIASGAYANVTALNLNSPVNAGAIGALNGTLAANRASISSTITGLTVDNGQNFCIRWVDIDATPGADDGLAIDDFSLTPGADGNNTNPTGTGIATPSSVAPGGATTLTATIAPGSSSTGITVNCDLTAIGGLAAFNLPNTATNTYAANYNVPGATSPNVYSLPCTVTDAQLQSGTFNIALTVTGSSTPPTATGLATPATVTAGNSTTLTATPASGAGPASSSYTETCNLTAIGGGSSVALPIAYVVPAATAPATYTLPCTVTDNLNRSSTFSIALAVQSIPATFRRIYEITGAGASSPLAGASVSTRGVVTAVRGTTGSTKGFYLESLPADRDNNTNTSEGLLVFIGSSALPACAVAGNYVQIDGVVSDFVPSTAPIGSVPLTEFANTSNCQVLGSGALASLPAPVAIDSTVIAPGGSAIQSRKLLGMRVSIASAITVGPSLGNLNETTATATPSNAFFVTVQGVPRPFRAPGILATQRPSDAPNTVPSWNGNPEVFRIDTTGLAGGASFEVATGTTVTGISGVMDYSTSEGQYQIYSNAAGAGSLNPAFPTLSATPIPAPLPTDLLIVNANLERFFNDKNDGNGNSVILTAAGYQGRLNKFSLAMRNVLRLPDIVTLEEVEGPGPTENLVYPVPQDIVNKINSDAASAGSNPNYNWCQYPTNDIGQISVSIIYRQDRVSLLDCKQFGLATNYLTPGGGSSILNDRPPVVLRANVTAPGSDSPLQVRIVVNHLRSLNGIDEPGAANGDRVRAKRNEQAKFLGNLLTGNSSEQTANWNVTDNLLVAGDMNAFEVNDGYVDVVNCFAGNPPPADQQYFTPAELAVSAPCTSIPTLALNNLTTADPAQRYSYVFSGTAQRLDHILVNNKLNSRVRQFVYARNNADFPEGPTYRNNFNRPERYSDHDMPAVYLKLPVEVSSRSRLNASPLTLNRATGRASGTITVTNTGTASLTGPVFVFFNNLPAGVTLPDLPQQNGVPYATIDLPAGLAPGATSGSVSISFANPSNARIGYTTQRFDGSY